MHSFKADVKNNRLYMHMEGFYSNDELQKAVNIAMLESKRLQPGYTVINDITELHISDMEGLQHIKKLMEFASNNGTKKVIRIIKNKLSKMQFEHVTEGANYDIVEVNSLEEAEKYLKEYHL